MDYKINHKEETITINGTCSLKEFHEVFSEILRKVIKTHRG